MKRIINVAKILPKISHYLLNTLLVLLLFIVIILFIFVVSVKINPKKTENLIVYSIAKISDLSGVTYSGVDVTIKNGTIQINIKNFSKQTAKIILQGEGARVKISLYNLWHGSLYEATIEKFTLKLQKIQENEEQYNSNNAIAKYYSFIPALKIFIKNLNLNIYGNVFTFEDARLSINESNYILSIQTHSKKDEYKINIFLNRKDLFIYFNGISSIFLNKHTQDAMNFIEFSSLNGKIIVDTNNIKNIKFDFNGKNITLLKSKFTQEDLPIKNLHALGSLSDDSIFLKLTNVEIFENTVADLSIKKEYGSIDVLVHAENAMIKDVKKHLTDYILNLSGLQKTFQYLKEGLGDGVAKTVDVKVHTPVLNQSDVLVNVQFENTSLLYNKYFPEIYNANGDVEVNRDYTIVNLVSGNSGRNVVKNSRAVINHATHYLSLYIAVEGSPANIANTFDVKNDYTSFNKNFEGDVKLKTFIGVNLNCDDVYFCTNVKGTAHFTNVLMPLSSKPVSGKIVVEKHHKKDMKIHATLKNFKSQYFDIKEFTASHSLNFGSRLLEIKNITMKDTQGITLTKVKLLQIPFKDNITLKYADIPLINLAHNNFALKLTNDKKKEINISGKSICVPEIVETVKNFKSFFDSKPSNTNEVKQIFSNLLKYDFFAQIGNVEFYNNVSTPFYLNIAHDIKRIGIVDLQSKLIQYHYHRFEKDKAMQGQKTKLTIPNLNTIILAANMGNEKLAGTIELEGFYGEDGSLNWSGAISGLQTYIGKINFTPHKFNVEARFFDNVLSFKNIKIYDKSHTIFTTGKILTDQLEITAKAYYTPSKIEVLNTMPLVQNALSVTTLGQNKNGLISLEFDVYGSIFSPEVKFEKSSPIKSAWKLGFGVVFLPLALL